MSAIPRHKDRLSAIDASYPLIEKPNTHVHVGALLIFEGPAPEFSHYVDHVGSRLHLAPRFRQRLVFPPFGTGRPIWIDDINLNLEHHIRQIDLPSPGSEKGLRDIAGRIFSQQLDRTRPLWEITLVRGLSENRFALIFKIHHSMINPISVESLIPAFCDLEPDPELSKHPDRQWAPKQEPSKSKMALDGVREHLYQALFVLRVLVGAIKHPLPAIRRTSEMVKSLREIAKLIFRNPAPETFLNVETGPHRIVEWSRLDLDQVKQVKNKVGGTVNDVVLAVVARALGTLFDRRGHGVEGLKLEGMVPVSINAGGDIHTVAVRGPLPLNVEDPLQLLQDVRDGMISVKKSRQVTNAKVLLGMNDFLPPLLLAQVSRINYSTRLFNLIVTNLRGPQTPLYVLGRRLLNFYATVFMPERHALAIAVFSYNGSICFSFLADPDVISDLHILREDTEQAFVELYEAATGKVMTSL